MLVDSHCHLDFPDFKDEMDEVVKRAVANDVGVMQTICTHVSKFPQVLAVAEKYENVYASVGIHPHEAEKEQTTVEELVELASHPKVIGIGETGLDFYYEHSPRDIQEEQFRIHIEASRKTGCPVIVHSRDADEKTVEVLQDEYKKGEFKFLIHCFSSTSYLAEKSIELGGYVSISGIITFKKTDSLREAVKPLPLERLLVETDAPFLAPTPFRGKRNEPAYTKNTAEFLAELKGVTYEELAEKTTNNFFEIFDKAKRP